MGLSSKLGRAPPPPTTIDYVEEQTEDRFQSDAEKVIEGSQVENSVQTPIHHINPEAEKAVVRKLDWRVPPLVVALCMLSTFKYLKPLAEDITPQTFSRSWIALT